MPRRQRVLCVYFWNGNACKWRFQSDDHMPLNRVYAFQKYETAFFKCVCSLISQIKVASLDVEFLDITPIILPCLDFRNQSGDTIYWNLHISAADNGTWWLSVLSSPGCIFVSSRLVLSMSIYKVRSQLWIAWFVLINSSSRIKDCFRFPNFGISDEPRR